MVNHIGYEKSPSSYGGQQYRVLDNELMFDPVTFREGAEGINRKPLSVIRIVTINKTRSPG